MFGSVYLAEDLSNENLYVVKETVARDVGSFFLFLE
jgi:hypothetical protein